MKAGIWKGLQELTLMVNSEEIDQGKLLFPSAEEKEDVLGERVEEIETDWTGALGYELYVLDEDLLKGIRNLISISEVELEELFDSFVLETQKTLGLILTLGDRHFREVVHIMSITWFFLKSPGLQSVYW